MEEFEDAIEILREYEANAIRLAENARFVIGLLDLLRRITSKRATNEIIKDINACISNLGWNAEVDLSVGDNSDEGYEELREAVRAAVVELTGPNRKPDEDDEA